MKLPKPLAAVARALSGAPAEGKVDGAEARRLVAEEHAILLDVRTPEEFAAGHVDGAVNIPVQVLAGRLGELEAGRPIVTYCKAGGRSGKAAAMLRADGRAVHDLGPMSAWG